MNRWNARRVAAGIACAGLIAGTLGACGEKRETLDPGEPEPFTLVLDYFPNADHAPVYAAQAAGRFRDVGLDVRIRPPSDPSAPIKQVAAGRADLAISYEPEVIRARDQGVAVISVGALVQEPLTSIISLPKAGIRAPEDLAGKTVGTAGIDYQTAFLRSVLADARVERGTVTERNVGFNLTPALLTGRVDAVLGAFWNYEGTDLRLRRRDPRIIRIERAGVPTYDELVLVANEDALESQGERIRSFIAALARGGADLRRNPDPALRALLGTNRELDERLQGEVLKATLPLFEPPRGKPYGFQEPREWAAFTQWMSDNQLIGAEPEKPAYTNDLLPGRGL